MIVAKTALRRKKDLENQLEKTGAQMMTLEREISSIETANINKETLDALKNASSAMKNIHNGTTVDQVDQIVEDLREQHAVAEEISEAITQGAHNPIDEDELDEELAELQQEELDNRMLKTGSVPVSDQIHRLPAQPSGPRESIRFLSIMLIRCSQRHACRRRIRRGRRASETSGRYGDVDWYIMTLQRLAMHKSISLADLVPFQLHT